MEPDEQALIQTAIEKKYAPGSCLDDKEMRRLYGYLQLIGFSLGDISHVLERMEISRKRDNGEDDSFG